MMRKTKLITSALVMSCLSCAVMVNEPDTDWPDQNIPEKPVYSTINTGSYFPFENNSNWWMFSEDGGNQLIVKVTDTISDDNMTYYRISFQEHRVDTTDDWFKRVGGDILFGSSLTGIYKQFLPRRLELKDGTIQSKDSSMEFTFHDSLLVKEKVYREVLQMKFETPLIHGFEEIWLANFVGVIMLKDFNGRWPVVYSLDSSQLIF